MVFTRLQQLMIEMPMTDEIKKWIDETIDDDLSGFEPDVDWGSCQYDTAKAMYDFYFAARNKGLTMAEVVEAIGGHLTIGDIKPLAKIKEAFADERGDEDDAELMKEIADAESVDDLFEIARERAMDLWMAAPMIAECCFETFEIGDIPESPGFGPILNVAVQSENYYVGLCCAILKDVGLVTDEESFKDFDT